MLFPKPQFIGEVLALAHSFLGRYSFLAGIVCVCVCVCVCVWYVHAHAQYHGLVLFCSVLETPISLAVYTL